MLWPELIQQWELSPQWAGWIDEREGLSCEWCGSNLRAQQLARAIVGAANLEFGTAARSLSELCGTRSLESLSVAEINSAGSLHPILAALPMLRYSEYGGGSCRVPSENLMSLSYADASFDLVITSDTLEHVPDLDRALSEIRRVLKPSGLHIFTVPVVWDSPATRKRASLNDGVLVHHLPPSHHGTVQENAEDFLVFYEFGADFVARCERAGFSLQTIMHATNPSVAAFVSRRVG